MPTPLRTQRGVFAEINMIPLIDISLILLIIFMVLTPALVQSQLAVKLPKSTQGKPIRQGDAIEVAITSKGKIEVNGREVELRQLEKELTLVLGRASEKTVMVQADRGVPIQTVVRVLDAAKKLGVERLGIGVRPS